MSTIEPQSTRNYLLVGIVVTIVMALGVVAIFLSANPPATDSLGDVSEIQAEVDRLLALADEERLLSGATLLNETYECYVCHVSGESQIAPPFERLPLHIAESEVSSASVYIYEAIVQPASYIVAGYNNSMPANYGDRLTDAELGTLIAYLLETYVEATP
jgi:hypothetical protein